MPEGSCFCCFFMVCTYEVPHMEKWPVNMTHELFSNMQGVNSKTSKRSHFKLKLKGLTFSCLYNHTCLLTFHLLTSRGENTPIFVQNTTLVITQKISKGGLISESLSLWLHLPKKCAKSLFWALFSYRKDTQDSICHIFYGDWSQREEFSEIKPPWTDYYYQDYFFGFYVAENPSAKTSKKILCIW